MKKFKNILVPILALAVVFTGIAFSVQGFQNTPNQTDETTYTPDPMLAIIDAGIEGLQNEDDLHTADPFAPYPDTWPAPTSQAFLDCMANPRADTGEYIWTAWDPTFHTVPNPYYDQATGQFVEATVKAELNDTFGRAVVYNKMAWEWDGMCMIHKWHVGAANVAGSVPSPQNFWACYMQTTPFFQTFNNGNPGFTRDEVIDRSACATNNPTISSINPPTGLLAGGYTITITGARFGTAPTATVDGNACAIVSGNDTTVVCTVPAGAATGLVPVIVTDTITGINSAPYNFTYTNVPAPSITSIAPGQGYITGGYPVTITGQNFGTAPTVLFGGQVCTVISSNNSEVVCTVPAGAAVGNVDVFVTNTVEGLTSPAYIFNYIAVCTDGDTQPCVIAHGTGEQTCLSQAWGICTVTACDAGYVQVGNACVFDPAPSILSINPTSGPEAGNTMVVITGTMFDDNAVTTLGGNLCTDPTVIGGTQIVCYTPAGTGAVDVVVTNPNAKFDTVAGGYTYIADGDMDNDKNLDAVDNCPNIPNRVQKDTDGDGHGDRCDVDDDNDTVLDRKWALSVKNVNGDNCQDFANPAQTDQDSDLWGLGCDDDDLVPNTTGRFIDNTDYENCSLTNTYSTNQDPYCYDVNANIDMSKTYDLCIVDPSDGSDVCFREMDWCETVAGGTQCEEGIYRPTDAEYLVNNLG